MNPDIPDTLRITTIHGESRTLYVLVGTDATTAWETIVAVDARELATATEVQL